MSSVSNDIRNSLRGRNSTLNRIIALNVFVFVGINVLKLFYFLSGNENSFGNVIGWLGVPASTSRLLERPWTIITYCFTHVDFFHILFNMIFLYWLGNLIVEYLGNKKIIPLYILGSVTGAAVYILAYNLFPVFKPALPYAMAIGASGGVLAILVAAATLLPNYSVMLIFIGPVRLVWIAAIYVIIDLLSIPNGNAGGHLAHLGGALFGFLFIRGLKNGIDLGGWMNRFIDWVTVLFSKRKNVPRVVHSHMTKENVKAKKLTDERQAKLDSILEKISRSGYDNLTAEEKEFLFRASRED